jgi:hypothetical protein
MTGESKNKINAGELNLGMACAPIMKAYFRTATIDHIRPATELESARDDLPSQEAAHAIPASNAAESVPARARAMRLGISAI